MTAPTAAPTPNLSAAQAGDLMKRATYASVSVAVILIAAKFGAWLVTESVSLLSTLVDSLLDAAASLINLIAVRQALAPPDREHRFGHGKAEPLAGLAQAAFIGGSALFLVLQAVQRLVRPVEIMQMEAGLWVMGGSVALTAILVLYQKSVVRRTGSTAIAADSLHYQSDLLVNLGVALSLVLAGRMGWWFADPLFALAIGAYIVKGAWQIGRNSLELLMDHELPEAERQRIRDIVKADPGVVSLHDLRTRSAGPQSFIQLHLEMNPDLPLREAHAIADRVMHAVETAFPKAEVLIHQDPAGFEEPPALAKS